MPQPTCVLRQTVCRVVLDHQDALDPAAVATLQEQLVRPVGRDAMEGDPGAEDRPLGLELPTQGEGHVRHHLERLGAAANDPVEHLPRAVGRMSPPGHPGAQLLAGRLQDGASGESRARIPDRAWRRREGAFHPRMPGADRTWPISHSSGSRGPRPRHGIPPSRPPAAGRTDRALAFAPGPPYDCPIIPNEVSPRTARRGPSTVPSSRVSTSWLPPTI